MGQGRVIPQDKFNRMLNYTFTVGREQYKRDAVRYNTAANNQIRNDGYYSPKAAALHQSGRNSTQSAQLLDHNMELQTFYTQGR